MRHKVIVIVGPHKGDRIISDLCSRHHEVYLFEPMPEAAKWLAKYNDDPLIHVIEAACGSTAGRQPMNIYNRGLSSSLGVCTAQARDAFAEANLALAGTFEVEVVNLFDYLRDKGLDGFETLLTDAQGMDLEILKTLSPWLSERKIRTIICEADSDGFRHYDGLPSNNESDFHDFMASFPWYRCTTPLKRPKYNPDLSWELVP